MALRDRAPAAPQKLKLLLHTRVIFLNVADALASEGPTRAPELEH